MKQKMNCVRVNRSLCIFLVVFSIADSALAQTQSTPPWAYPVLAPGYQVPPDDGIPKQVPGSKASFTLTQLRDVFTAYDWFPEEHPPMPEVVAHGRKPNVNACGMCHLPNGRGRPENSSLAGLPVQYIIQHMADFKAGLRKSSEPAGRPASLMVTTGKNANDDEAKAAAEYFSSLKFKKWIRVVESDVAPKSQVVAGYMLAAIEGAGTEPIGMRIIEVPENLSRTELRDPHSGFIAYAPKGSIKRGEQLVMSGGGTTTQCTICHGLDLKGLGLVPSLAGRSPSYIVRQLYDFKNGARVGANSALMMSVVANLTIDDMIAIAAYTSSREP
ncbi:MAG TPA: c-type cytochrome [Steroidobacteraceae bacterium]|nr:c-type cytochrome [Steroidobacteraceae bacterium]